MMWMGDRNILMMLREMDKYIANKAGFETFNILIVRCLMLVL